MNNVVHLHQARLKAECVVLAILLSNPSDDNKRLASQLSLNDFLHRQLALTFEAMQYLMSQREPLDIITVGERLDETGKLDEAGGRAFLMDLAMSTYGAEIMSEQIALMKK